MALPMVPIYTQTVASSGVTGLITFNNIPQYYTDLKLVISARDNSAGTVYAGGQIFFNGNTSSGLNSTTMLITDGSGSPTPTSSRTTNGNTSFPVPWITAANATANTFNSVEVYIPNYTSSNYKQMIADVVMENNGSAAYQYVLALTAILNRTTTAITSISIQCSGTYIANSTFSLYGILRAGA